MSQELEVMLREQFARFVFPAHIKARSGLSFATAMRESKAGRFPAFLRLSPRRIAWLAADIEAWLEARKTGIVPSTPVQN